MALIECVECQGKVSDHAKACPHCGCPVTAATMPAESQATPALPAHHEATPHPVGTPVSAVILSDGDAEAVATPLADPGIEAAQPATLVQASDQEFEDPLAFLQTECTQPPPPNRVDVLSHGHRCSGV